MFIKFKLLINTPIFKKIMVGTITFVLLLLIILYPTLAIINNFNREYITGFNRDANSGTRVSFDEIVIDQIDYRPQHHVLEVANNDQMIAKVKKNKNSIGYVSLGTVGNFDEQGTFVMDELLEDDLIVLDYQPNGASEYYAPDKANIVSGAYTPQRHFNQFFRVDQGTAEADILNVEYSKSTNTFIYVGEDEDGLIELSPSEKKSYLFYEWVLYSKDASLLLEENGYLDASSANENNQIGDKKSFTKETYESYFDLLWDGDMEEVITDFEDSSEQIELVGSTSCIEIVKLEAGLFTEEISEILFQIKTGSNYVVTEFSPDPNLYFTFNFNGSGDAFKRRIPGSKNPDNVWIGYQSRNYFLSEITGWGWTEDDVPYNAFAIDTIVIIANKHNEYLDDENFPGIKQEWIQKIYATNEDITWEMIAKDEELG